MKRTNLNVLDTAVVNDYIYALVKRNERLSLLSLDKDLRVVDEAWSTEGRVGFILRMNRSKALVSVDNKLYLVEDGKAETVLTIDTSENTFWHLTEVNGKLFMVHEYGRPPTSIYASNDLKNWEKIATNLDIDKSSKHFHDIAYDPYRKWLIITLGDGCLTRVAISEDLGSSWRPLYRGPWQFVPILVLRDKLVFGMDSGIARGGVGVYNPSNNQWSFIFLKWYGREIRFAQMCDLKLLDNSFYIAGLGAPQAVVVSRDLRTWHPVHIEGFYKQFNMHVTISNGKGFVACSTGKSLLLLTKDEIEDLMQTTDPIIVNYRSYIERLIGLGFSLKRRLVT